MKITEKIWLKTWNAMNYIYGLFMFDSRKRLSSLKNIHAGKRCFIIGNGPSLRKEDLQKLYQRGEYTFACNSLINLFDELPFYPTYYFVQDNKVLLNNKEKISHLKGEIFVKSHYAKRYRVPGATYYNMLFKQNPIGFSHNIQNVVYSGQTVAYSMIQFATYMGFTEIYLMGIDCSYSINNNAVSGDSYFDKKMFDPKKPHNLPEVDTMLLSFEQARKTCEPMGIRICNAARGGKLEIFPRVDFDTLFE